MSDDDDDSDVMGIIQLVGSICVFLFCVAIAYFFWINIYAGEEILSGLPVTASGTTTGTEKVLIKTKCSMKLWGFGVVFLVFSIFYCFMTLGLVIVSSIAVVNNNNNKK